MRVPDWISYEEASTIGLGVFTCGQGLYQNMRLPFPNLSHQATETKEKPQILIYGGSTSTGMFAIQLACLSGFEVLTTCSPRNFDLVKGLGAGKAYDYHDAGCGARVRLDTGNWLFYAYNCVGDNASARICSEALSSECSPEGGKPKYGTVLLSEKMDRADVDVSWSLVFSAIGDAFTVENAEGQVLFDCPAKAEDFEFAKQWAQIVEKLVADKKLKAHRMEVRAGLESAVQGIDDSKKMSGKKLVCTLHSERP